MYTACLKAILEQACYMRNFYVVFFLCLYSYFVLINVYTVQTALFQLRLLGISDCVQWKVSVAEQ